MTRRLTALAPLLSIALLGCAANRHLKHGDEFAALGDWSSALREYEAAEARRPRDGEIADLVDHARAQAVADALDAASAALEGDDLGAAHEALVEARRLQPDVEEIAMLEDRLVAIGLERAAGLGARGDADGAYRLAARIRGWYPTEDAARAVRDARNVIIGESGDLADQGRFHDALDRLQVIEDVEPRTQPLAAARAEVRGRWADSLVLQARVDEKAGRLGSAFLATAAAASLAGRPEDAIARDRLQGALVAQDGLAIDLDVSGDAEARRQIEAAVRGAVDGPAVRLVEDPRADVSVDVNLAPVRFDETLSTWVAEQRYLAGYDEVPNPAYREQRAVVDHIESLVADRAEEARAARERSVLARADVEAARLALIPQEAAWKAAEAAGAGTDSAAYAAYAEAKAVLDRAVAIRDEREAAEQACEEKLAGARGELGEERRELDGLSAILLVERWDTFRYAVDRVERTAKVVATVRTGDDTVRVMRTASVVDDAHSAFVRYGVSEDPLIFGVSDDALLDRAWSSAADEVASTVQSDVIAWREGLIDTAIASDGEAAARAWALAALADPNGAPDGFQRYLDVRWDGLSAAWVE